MSKSRAECMQDYRQRKSEDKLKTRKVEPNMGSGALAARITKMDESRERRAEYMRDYMQKKRAKKLKTGEVESKKIACYSTRDFRAPAANSSLLEVKFIILLLLIE